MQSVCQGFGVSLNPSQRIISLLYRNNSFLLCSHQIPSLMGKLSHYENMWSS